MRFKIEAADWIEKDVKNRLEKFNLNLEKNGEFYEIKESFVEFTTINELMEFISCCEQSVIIGEDKTVLIFNGYLD